MIKEGDWVCIPNAGDLVGQYPYYNGAKFQVDEVEGEEVWAGGVRWKKGEWEPCASPLYYVPTDAPLDIRNGDGLLVAMFTQGNASLLPVVLKALNQEWL